MRAITCSIIVERPIEEVFAFITDARNMPLWQRSSGLRESQQAPDSLVGVGTRIIEVRELMGRTVEDHNEVTEYQPNHRYVRSQIGDGGPITRCEFTFETVAEGTHWVAVTHIHAGDHAAIDESLLAATLQRSITNDMAAAKALLERRMVENAR